MKIRLLKFDGCPNVEPTRRLIEEAIERLGVEASLDLIEVTEETAPSERFFGSPTVQVDGVDVDPAAREREDYAMSCRRYATDGGPEGVPPRAMIEAALAGDSSPG